MQNYLDFNEYNTNNVSRIIIRPRKIRPFDKIEDVRKRAIVILHLAGFSQCKLNRLFKCDKRTIVKIIEEAKEIYPGIIKE